MKRIVRYWEVEEHRDKNKKLMEKKYTQLVKKYLDDNKTYVVIDDDSSKTERTDKVESKSVNDIMVKNKGQKNSKNRKS